MTIFHVIKYGNISSYDLPAAMHPLFYKIIIAKSIDILSPDGMMTDYIRQFCNGKIPQKQFRNSLQPAPIAPSEYLNWIIFHAKTNNIIGVIANSSAFYSYWEIDILNSSIKQTLLEYEGPL